MHTRIRNTASLVLSILILFFYTLCCRPCHADVRLPAIVSNHMVVQGNSNPRIWGWASPAEKIKVKFLGKTLQTAANSSGKWEVRLGRLKPGTNFDIDITGKNRLSIKDVLVGEVWLCGGQSNMVLPLSHTDHSELEFESHKAPQIRFFKEVLRASLESHDDVEGSWELFSPNTAKHWSAVGYFFAKDLNARLKEPVGIIQATVSGTMLQVWMSPGSVESTPSAGRTWAQSASHNCMYIPSYIFHSMINGITLYTLRGITWYQGESNEKDPAIYRKLFPRLIKDWRKQWKDDNLPFVFVQLPNYGKATPPNDRSLMAEMREAQALALNLNNTAMVVTIDVGDPKELHPTNKRPVGHRLALAALATVYRVKVPYRGPVISSMKTQNGSLVCQCKYTDKGLRARNHGELTGFQVAGKDSHFVAANAKIVGTTITISSPKVPNPTELRYAWSDSAEGNLENGCGLPAPPFRLDPSAPKPEL